MLQDHKDLGAPVLGAALGGLLGHEAVGNRHGALGAVVGAALGGLGGRAWGERRERYVELLLPPLFKESGHVG